VNLIVQAFSQFAATCSGANRSFFGLPTWYKYLEPEPRIPGAVNDTCKLKISDLGDIWLIGLGVLDILLRLIGLIAVGFIIWGGIQYLTSQGEPDRTKAALSTIINAFVGLVIAVAAAGVVYFIAGGIT
jgi:hypothetical protein